MILITTCGAGIIINLNELAQKCIFMYYSRTGDQFKNYEVIRKLGAWGTYNVGRPLLE